MIFKVKYFVCAAIIMVGLLPMYLFNIPLPVVFIWSVLIGVLATETWRHLP